MSHYPAVGSPYPGRCLAAWKGHLTARFAYGWIHNGGPGQCNLRNHSIWAPGYLTWQTPELQKSGPWTLGTTWHFPEQSVTLFVKDSPENTGGAPSGPLQTLLMLTGPSDRSRTFALPPSSKAASLSAWHGGMPQPLTWMPAARLGSTTCVCVCYLLLRLRYHAWVFL